MTEDILAQLRSISPLVETCPKSGLDTWAVAQIAAEEIERLRARIAELEAERQ